MNEDDRDSMRLRQLIESLCSECRNNAGALLSMWAAQDIARRELAESETKRRQEEEELKRQGRDD